MNKDLLLGIDFGTGGCKLTLIDTAGTVVAACSGEYPTRHPRPGWAEQAPEDWYAVMCRLLRELRPAARGNLLALALDGYTHGAVLLDGHMRVIRPTIVWTDQRSTAECARLTDQHFDLVFNTAWQAPAPTWTLPQIMWLQANEPDNCARVRHVSFVKDYVRYRLTDALACDFIEAQGTMFWDMRAGCWSPELCALAGLPPDVLPPVGRPADQAGRITARAAADTGLPEGVTVIMGSSDTAVEALAAGAVAPGQCVVKLATAGNVNIMTAAPHPHRRTLTYAHVAPGLWYSAAATNAAAVCQRWWRELLRQGAGRTDADGGISYARLNALAAAAPPGANGVMFHPYLMGERAPYWDPDLRAGFSGLRMDTAMGDLSRALLEGVAFSLRDCCRVLEAMDLRARELLLIGGGARSDIWRRIVCDVFKVAVRCPVAADASFGGALLAGIGCGVYADPAAAAAQCVKYDRRLDPVAEDAALYDRLFEHYRRVHDALADLHRPTGE